MLKKEKDIKNGKGEDDIDWITINGSHVPIKKGQSEKDIEQIIEDHFENPKYVMLPKSEYKGLCSAIKSKYGNDIPNKGKILYKDFYYCYNFNSQIDRIICTEKVEIDNTLNKVWERKYDKRNRK